MRAQVVSLASRSLLAIALMLASQSSATAGAPLQEWQDFDFDFLLPGATAACGFPVRAHLEGRAHFTVFYDQEGQIIREVDTFPSLKITVYSPTTGKSYTSAQPAVLITDYEPGAAIGSEAIAYASGLFEKIGDVALEGGRIVFSAEVVAYDPAGVPLIQFTGAISESGPHVDGPIGVARCNAVK